LPEGIDIEEYLNRSESTGIEQYLGFLSEAVRSSHPIQSLANGAYLFFDRKMLHGAPIPRIFDDGTKAVLDTAVRKLDDENEPFVGFLNLMEAHAPMAHVYKYDRSLHDAPYSWSSQHTLPYDELNVFGDFDDYERELDYYRGLYAATIDYLDRMVLSFIDRIQSKTVHETTFVLTSDHGELLVNEPDDPLFGHNVPRVSEGLLHVPLDVINPPDGAPERVDRHVSHLDLGDIVCAFAQNEYEEPTTSPVVAERITSVLPGKLGLKGNHAREWSRCGYVEDSKYVWTSEGAEYEMRVDSASRVTVVDEDATVPADVRSAFETDLAELRNTLNIESGLNTGSVDSATQERLADLGYL
jgi:arylsulfatase A-like enzyme